MTINLTDLENEGFELIAEQDNYYPYKVKSGKYTFKSIYYNPSTNEIKAILKETLRAKTLAVKEIPLNDIRLLDNNNPVKKALSLLESEEFQNNQSDLKSKLKNNKFK